MKKFLIGLGDAGRRPGGVRFHLSRTINDGRGFLLHGAGS